MKVEFPALLGVNNRHDRTPTPDRYTACESMPAMSILAFLFILKRPINSVIVQLAFK
ncbi:MAG: hypothetical protein MKZ95_03530 [Pirellulales bacterium]|nr:hypothetical protein [Pirellulales bacterium]